MLKTFYVQVEKDTNKITDVIEFAYEDYKEVQLETPLPNGILAGTYKLVNSSALYVQEWDNNELLKKIEVLNEQSSKLLIEKAKNEVQISNLNKSLASITLEVAKLKGGM